MEDMVERFGRFFNRQPARRNSGQETLTVADWIPTVDISEDDNEYLLKVELPDVDKKDVKVTVQDGTLNIQGERRQEQEQNNRRFHRIERRYGTFFRSFTLPEDVAEEQLRAEFKDGMLYVHLPKTEKPQPQAKEIKVA
jgi:HSP20 family protein